MDPRGNDFVHFALSVLGTQKDERSNLRCMGDTSRLSVSLPSALMCKKIQACACFAFSYHIHCITCRQCEENFYKQSAFDFRMFYVVPPPPPSKMDSLLAFGGVIFCYILLCDVTATQEEGERCVS